MRLDWSIIVHGGAGARRPERQAGALDGCLAATLAGQAVLERGGSAVEAVEAAIRILEDDPHFNAGYGSVLNADGEVETDAGIMDGRDLSVGGVAALKGVRNPISVASAMLPEPSVLIAGEGARRFAATHGGELCDPAELIAPHRHIHPASDTVGCVAFDREGNFAAGNSTGGIRGKPPGRVGDSPIPGCGMYAENGVGGVCFSGDGEVMIRLTSAARLMADLVTVDVEAAAMAAIARVAAMAGEAGCIVLGPDGQPAFAHNSVHFAVGAATSAASAQAWIKREDWEP